MKYWTPQRYFVDKSNLIKTFLRSRHKAVMICAPQGFLKTSNLEMIATFLSIEPNADEKENRRFKWRHLNIMRSRNLVDHYFGEFPVVCIPAAPRNSSYTVEDHLVHAIRLAYWDHKELQISEQLSEKQRSLYKLYSTYTTEQIGKCEYKLADALKILCELLYTHYGKRVYVFFDNFDSYLLEAVLKGRPMVNIEPILLRMLTSLHISVAVKRVFLTGITTLAGWRRNFAKTLDFKIYKFLGGHKFMQYFGLTDDDIRVLAHMNKCSLEITDKLLSNCHRTIKRKRIYSPEWVHDFLQHSFIENPIWFDDIFLKPNLLAEINRKNKVRTLIEGGCVKVNARVVKNELDLMQLNRLCNGSYEGPMEEEELDLIFALLYELGAVSFVDHKSLKLSMECWPSSRQVKLICSDTSRIGAALRRLIS